MREPNQESGEHGQMGEDLHERRRILHLVISSMPNLLFVIDDQDRLSALFVPPHFPRIWRVPELQAGQPLADVLPNGIADQIATNLAQVRTSGKLQICESSTTLDGETLFFEIRISPVPDLGGLLITMDNITERKQAEAERERLIEELNTFARTVAHDLKNPLTSIVGYANLLKDYHERLPVEQLKDHLADIARTGYKMSNIIDELLLLASMREAEVETTPIDMGPIVEEALERLTYMIKDHEAEIVLPPTWPMALGYASWIEEVWANYVSNAIKYGGEPPRVELGAIEQPDGTICFWVRDNGPGISPEAQPLLFKPFTQLNQVSAKGHGLGLSIAQRIVEKLGGQVGIESDVGQGSVFTFTLPGIIS